MSSPRPEPATRQRIADYLAARTRGLCIIRTEAVVTHEGWTGPTPMVIRPGSTVDPYGLALGHARANETLAGGAGWREALLDLVNGRINGPVRIPASALREWLVAIGSTAVVSGEDWIAKRFPRQPGLAHCNGVDNIESLERRITRLEAQS
jgi:hypothetical protein